VRVRACIETQSLCYRTGTARTYLLIERIHTGGAFHAKPRRFFVTRFFTKINAIDAVFSPPPGDVTIPTVPFVFRVRGRTTRGLVQTRVFFHATRSRTCVYCVHQYARVSTFIFATFFVFRFSFLTGTEIVYSCDTNAVGVIRLADDRVRYATRRFMYFSHEQNNNNT